MSAAHISVVLFSILLNPDYILAFEAGHSISSANVSALRETINTKRLACGLAAKVWTDAISPGVVIKKIHMDEMRAAVSEIYTSQAQPAPNYTDPLIAIGVTTVKAVHFNELQSFTTNALCHCKVLAATSWDATGNTCNADADVIVPDGGPLTIVADTTGPNTGTVQFTCANGVLSAPVASNCEAEETSNAPEKCLATTKSWLVDGKVCSGVVDETASTMHDVAVDNFNPDNPSDPAGRAYFKCNAGI